MPGLARGELHGGNLLTPTMHVWTFLRFAQWQPTIACQNGNSWHELLALFQIKGGMLRANDALADDFQIGSSIRKDLADFKLLVRRALDIYGSIGDTSPFRPARDKNHRLQMYGIENHVPCITAEACLTPGDSQQLHRAMACMALVQPAKTLQRLKMGF